MRAILKIYRVSIGVEEPPVEIDTAGADWPAVEQALIAQGIWVRWACKTGLPHGYWGEIGWDDDQFSVIFPAAEGGAP